jgi:hypothetical protein
MQGAFEGGKSKVLLSQNEKSSSWLLVPGCLPLALPPDVLRFASEVATTPAGRVSWRVLGAGRVEFNHKPVRESGGYHAATPMTTWVYRVASRAAVKTSVESDAGGRPRAAGMCPLLLIVIFIALLFCGRICKMRESLPKSVATCASVTPNVSNALDFRKDI